MVTDEKIKKVKQLLVKNRIRILELLLEGETCVCVMVSKLDLKHSLISHHLKILTDSGFIKGDKNGQHVMYKLNKSKVKSVQEIMDLIINI